MKIFNWMQSKIQGKAASAAKKPTDPFSFTVTLDHQMRHQDYSPVESNDWWPASGLLTIGTFGLNKNLHLQEEEDLRDTTMSQDDTNTLPLEEVLKMSEKICSMIEDADSDDEQAIVSSQFKRDPEDEDHSSDLYGIERSISFALSRGIKCNDTCSKKSLKLIFKNIYSKGFPGLKHPMPESRIDKILRAILHKKIYPQSSSTRVKKWLKNKLPTASEMKNTDSKWIKTDSDYIVLEM